MDTLDRSTGFPLAHTDNTLRDVDFFRFIAVAVLLADPLLVLLWGFLWYDFFADNSEPIFHLTLLYQVCSMLAFVPLLFGSATSSSLLRCSFLEQVIRPIITFCTPLLFCIALTWAILPKSDARLPSLLEWQAVLALSGILSIGLLRLAYRKLMRIWREQGLLKQTIAVVGVGELAERLLRSLNRSCGEIVHVVGVFDDRASADSNQTSLSTLNFGSTDDLIQLSRRLRVDRVIVALPYTGKHGLANLITKLKRMPVDISLALDYADYSARDRGMGEYGGLTLAHVHGRPLEFKHVLLKCAFDRIVALVLLIVAFPIMLAAAIAIKLDSRGSVLFKQDRYGFGSRVIKIHKFRTMYSHLTDHGGRRQAQRNDHRVTRFGRFLRATSIDELPQLFDVLRGDMSLVGPRPMPIKMCVEGKPNHELIQEYEYRHMVKPGLTGWAQVNGHRGPIATVEELNARLAHDLYYIHNWSILFDLKILLMTCKVCVAHPNAY